MEPSGSVGRRPCAYWFETPAIQLGDCNRSDRQDWPGSLRTRWSLWSLIECDDETTELSILQGENRGAYS